MTYTSQLRELAGKCGVSTSYRGWDHTEHEVSDSTLHHILAARGIGADTEDDVAASLRDLDEAPWRRTLPPVVVIVQGETHRVEVHVPHGDPVSVHVTTEHGEHVPLTQIQVWVDPREIDGALVGRATFGLPADLPIGWHTVTADSEIDSAHRTRAQCPLVVTPRRLSANDALLGEQRSGLAAQLYSIRSDRSWGVGDYADLADLSTIAGGTHGFDYVLVNPLHAQRPEPPVEASPYLPTTRRFFDPMYIRVEDIPETAYLPRDQYAKVRESARRFSKANKRTRKIDRDPSFRAKLRALSRIHRVTLSATRQAEFDAFCEREGHGLDDFALWCALAEKFGPEDKIWQVEAAHPGTDFATEFRSTAADRIAFHKWLQWTCDQQLERAQLAARRSGMDIGIMHDLAVGVHRQGADAWTLGDALTAGVTVGAPPDNFNQQGQNWNQPPWNPDRLRELGYGPYRDMLRTILRHAGGVRVDHILGLFRLWWIPQAARTPGDGAYVEYDHEALIGILVLEAERAGAVVVGEDLGVFEPRVQEYLGQRGVFGTSILWFENDGDSPIPPENYRELCLTSVTTHDLPPTVGYLRGEHIALRSRLGLLERDVEAETAQDAAGREAVLDLARTRGLLSADASEKETVEALYRLIARSPSNLLGVALVDAVGENRIQNQPGTDETQYQNWRIPLADHKGRAVWVDDLVDHPRMVSLVAALNEAALKAGLPPVSD
ncbi:4-alpha-glucanotransferase [Rhodococcus sp. EPR-157]|uniref:4-alpha-glucanotransferase n=1 Tax=Rhodococcus sp. EPR-157 TaxID=1813677 RepID=UPI0007BAE104|nr:4-alpha-glucanotransferase [Rhodococcus sp. EPR-157]KZF02029.1 4-alpha-glucanotransferase [Rhodococcus sp. EPR-157]